MAMAAVFDDDGKYLIPVDSDDIIGTASIYNNSSRVIKKEDAIICYTYYEVSSGSSHDAKGEKIFLGRDLEPGVGIHISLRERRPKANAAYSCIASLETSPGDYLQWSHQHVSMYDDEGQYRKPCFDIRLDPLGDYQIEDEPLAEAEVDAVNHELLQILQSSTPFSSNMWDQNMWDQIAERVSSASTGNSRPGRSAHRLKKIWHDYDDPHPVQEPPYWSHIVYQQHRKTLEEDITGKWLNQSYLNQCLRPGGRARIDTYWRAMDRRPGGNTDQHIICYTIDCGRQAVSMRTYSNFDGELTRTECTPMKLAQRISSWLPNNNNLPTLLESLRSLGLGNSECTILDTHSRDEEEYDSTWTSQEILVSVPRLYTWETRHLFRSDTAFQELRNTFFLVNNRLNAGLQSETIHAILEWAAPDVYVPVTRLHRGCVMGSQWYNYGNRRRGQLDDRPPTHVQQGALQAVEELVGMGRVNTWSDAGDGAEACEASCDFCATRKDMSETCRGLGIDLELPDFIQPFYFDFPARI